MTPTLAREQLINADPDLTYEVSEERWYYPGQRNTLATTYVINILPGLDGSPCTRLAGHRLDLILTDALTALKLNAGR